MPGLRKVLKLRTVVSASAGLAMATSCYLAGLQVAIMAVGELAWISILVAGFFCLLSAMCFSELTSMYPSAAGIKLFIQHAFNEKTAVAIGMFYVIVGASIVGAESYLLSSVMIETLGVYIAPMADRFFWMAIFIILVGYINYRGVKITGRVQDILTYLMLGFLVLVSIYTFSITEIDMAAALSNPRLTVSNVFLASGLGVVLYMGFEWVAPLAEETEDYRMVGKGMMIAVGLLSITYSLFTVAMYSGLTEEQLQSGSSIPHILFARNLFGGPGAAAFIVMSILASLTSFNSGLLNTSRFTYALARANILPRFFSKLHPDYATPWAAILSLVIFALGLSVLILVTGKFLFVITLSAALECFIYVVIALSVIVLRKKEPDRERAYRVPFGYLIPVVNVIVFSGLMIGIFAEDTRDYLGNLVFHNYWTAVVMAIFAGLMAIYAWTVAPRLQAAAKKRAEKRGPRRPGRKRPS